MPFVASDPRDNGIVLCIDDTPQSLVAIAECLRPTCRVLVANSARRGIEIALGETRPDLILLDVVMPEIDGYQCLTLLRQNPRTADIPVILVTAMDGVDQEERGLELGAVDYITKPVRPRIVRARVQTQLELKRVRDTLRDRNFSLEAEVARRMEENQLIQEVSIHALARLAETRDPETGNHINRTRAYVHLLAMRLRDNPAYAPGLTDRYIGLLTKSAPLHDIGKVGIPDHILLKPGKLTQEEWEIMRSHAQLGAEAIEMAERDSAHVVEFLVLAKEISRHHHEQWGGDGYPDGLQGEAIPLSARLMAVADVFDALISRRVYKDPMPFADARAAIADGRGRRFDPAIVDVFIENFDDFVAIAHRYADESEMAQG
jgi:putative two-component system response regulator